jgi:hypothetical protein
MTGPFELGAGAQPDNAALIEGYDASLHGIDTELAERATLLEAVTVDEHGVAVCERPDSGVVVRLAAVRVAGGDQAQQIPLRQEDDGKLVFALPGDTGSQIGLFMGHEGLVPLAGVARLGEYPGEALVTRPVSEALDQWSEVLINLGGMRDTELDERAWAQQIRLFEELGFDPEHSRGIFSRAQLKSPDSDQWRTQRLMVVPPDLSDLVEMPHPAIQSDILQILGYQTREYTPALEINPYIFTSPLRTGFGPEFDTTAPTSPIRLVGLRAAFEIQLVPEN